MREAYDPGHKFSDAMACYVHDNLNYTYAEEEWTDEVNMEGEWLLGKRVYGWDSQGFVYLTKFASSQEARAEWDKAHAARERMQDEACMEQGCTGTVCMHCGQTIARVTEEHATYYQDSDGGSLSYVPTLHDHAPILDDDTSSHVPGCARDWIG